MDDMDTRTRAERRAEEVSAARANVSTTRRITNAAMEEVIFEVVPVLDKGSIQVTDYMGDDRTAVLAARTSYGKGTKATKDDVGLIRYLMRHRHTTPFEMMELTIRVDLPVFVARQWIRHRTSSVNEISGRYSIMENEFYVPRRQDLAPQSKANRQGRAGELTTEQQDRVLGILKADAAQAYAHYEEMGDEDGIGLARELARIGLPLSLYTTMYWKVNVHNLLHFLGLRADAHAQYEIRAYADVLLDIVSKWLPATHSAFLDYRMNAFTLSAQMVEAVQAALSGKPKTRAELGMGKREFDEMVGRFPQLAGG